MGYLAGLDLIEHGALPRKEFLALQGSVNINLYVTLSECYPMTPMESYAAGVPCLTSRTSVLFRDDPELWSLTTVDEIDNPRAIAVSARRLLDRRDEAVAGARAWMERFDPVAAGLWRDFVSV